MIWENPKDPDVTDRYGFTLDPIWLDGETITSVTFTPTVESGIVVSSTNIDANTVTALLSGGNVGFWPVHVRVETATRQKEVCITLWVKEDC